MTLDQTIDLISRSKHTPCYQFINTVINSIQGIDGNFDECVIAILTSDKYIMWVEFLNGIYLKWSSKYIG